MLLLALDDEFPARDERAPPPSMRLASVQPACAPSLINTLESGIPSLLLPHAFSVHGGWRAKDYRQRENREIFEAGRLLRLYFRGCATFIGITAGTLAKSPSDPAHRRALLPMRLFGLLLAVATVAGRGFTPGGRLCLCATHNNRHCIYVWLIQLRDATTVPGSAS